MGPEYFAAGFFHCRAAAGIAENQIFPEEKGAGVAVLPVAGRSGQFAAPDNFAGGGIAAMGSGNLPSAEVVDGIFGGKDVNAILLERRRGVAEVGVEGALPDGIA